MVLNVAGLSLSLEDTPAGPLVSTAAYQRDDPRATLAWVMNMALTGELPDFEQTLLRKGELFISQGMSVSPVAPEEITPRDELKWLKVGKSLLEGEDVFLLATTFTHETLMMPGRVLLELFRKLVELRAGFQRSRAPAPRVNPPAPEPQAPSAAPAPRRADFVELEQRAVALDALMRKEPKTPDEAVDESVKRRLLLLDLDAAGVLTDERAEDLRMHLEAWVLPTLLGYQRAAGELLNYLRAPGRQRYIKGESGPARVLGARVSVDWFRLGQPTPSQFDAVNWLGFCERILLEAAPGSSGAGTGTLFTSAGRGSCSIVWRADDGQTPAVLSAHYSE
jgi:hypothetical protein